MVDKREQEEEADYDSETQTFDFYQRERTRNETMNQKKQRSDRVLTSAKCFREADHAKQERFLSFEESQDGFVPTYIVSEAQHRDANDGNRTDKESERHGKRTQRKSMPATTLEQRECQSGKERGR